MRDAVVQSSNDNRLIFVSGNSRSGTTVMATALGLHSQVFTFKELHFFERVWAASDRDQMLPSERAVGLAARLLCIQRDGILFQGDERRFRAGAKEIIHGLADSELTAERVFEEFLGFEANQHNKRFACDQTPRNVFYIKEILELYPTARVIVMVRDPRDVLASQKHKWKMRFKGLNADPIAEAVRLKVNYHPVTTSMLWNAAANAGARWDTHPRVRILRFEDLVTAPEAEMAAICEFCLIPFELGMLQVPQVNSSYAPNNPNRRGFSADAAGGWQRGRLSPAEIYLCQRITAEGMRRHGYAAATVQPNIASLVASLALLPLKLGLALAFNLTQTRNVRDALKRRLNLARGQG
jgi:hypothetical protein